MDPTFSRVLLFRHLAICASALMAYALRSELEVGYAVLAIVGGSAVLNFTLYLLQTREVAARWALIASPVIGVGSWAFLIAVTKGVGSPFIAGLWLEIILSSMVFTHVGVFAVTAAATASLIGQQIWLGLSGNGTTLGLEAGFIIAMGAVSGTLNLRSERARALMQAEQLELGDRLEELVVEVQDERQLGRMGESVGRLAHGLKNTVHSLRGFVSLIEPNTTDKAQAALQGLRSAIDDLEELARMTLEDGQDLRSAREIDQQRGKLGSLDVLDAAIEEVRAASPGVVWEVDIEGRAAVLPLAQDDLHEVLQILLRNAVEAMDGEGRGEVEACVESGTCRITVRDHGPGFDPDEIDALFKPGYTTKPQGSGYGLFLARRVLSQHGGRLVAAPMPSGGAAFVATIPIARSE